MLPNSFTILNVNYKNLFFISLISKNQCILFFIKLCSFPDRFVSKCLSADLDPDKYIKKVKHSNCLEFP